MGRTKKEFRCVVCLEIRLKDQYELKRNAAKGRSDTCSRSCQATWMNMSEKKQAQTKAILAKRNAEQFREDNPNWKGGISDKSGHPLKPIPEGYKGKTPDG
jgi:hypothetical protein